MRRVSGSSPLSSTILEKSELIPHWERVRILYFAINKNGEASDLCRQVWHAFCQLSPTERETAAEWWQDSAVAGVQEQRIVSSLLRHADADTDLLTMLAKVGAEIQCTHLVGAVT